MKNKILLRRRKTQKRVRSQIIRKSAHPRLSVHRTNKHIYVQLIDDYAMKTLASASDAKLDFKVGSNMEKAAEVGKIIAQSMKKIKVNRAVFDRGAFPYKGRIKALCEAVRNEGITI